MGTTQLSIYKKYIQAKYSFIKHSHKIVGKLRSGRSNRKRESAYNVLSSWIDILGNSIVEPINIQPSKPNPLTVTVSTSSEVDYPATVNVFITTLEGFRELIGTLDVTEAGEVLSINVLHFSIDAVLESQSNSLSFTFPIGEKYNGGSIEISNATVAPHGRVAGGVDQYISPIPALGGAQLKYWDTLLDKAATEMQITYSNEGYLEAAVEFKKTPREREVLRLNDNKSLTTEDGRPLDV